MNLQRREALKAGGGLGLFGLLAAAGLITPGQARAEWNKSAFDAKTIEETLKALGASAPANSADVQITAPDIAENGAVVPVGATSKLPNTTEMYLIVEKNPTPLSAAFMIPAGTAADVQTRLKMGQSTNVIAVVKADGKLYSASKETKVTLGGCGG